MPTKTTEKRRRSKQVTARALNRLLADHDITHEEAAEQLDCSPTLVGNQAHRDKDATITLADWLLLATGPQKFRAVAHGLLDELRAHAEAVTADSEEGCHHARLQELLGLATGYHAALADGRIDAREAHELAPTIRRVVDSLSGFLAEDAARRHREAVEAHDVAGLTRPGKVWS